MIDQQAKNCVAPTWQFDVAYPFQLILFSHVWLCWLIRKRMIYIHVIISGVFLHGIAAYCYIFIRVCIVVP